MLNKYNTLEKYGRCELIEKKSRFITSGKPVLTEQEALEFIENIKKEFHNARHNVYAYSVGIDNPIERCSDDGEPSGTSGLPTLKVLQRNNIRNAVIVTTRYFGGILLGTGGLVRAYGKNASNVTIVSQIISKELFVKFSLTCEYVFLGKIDYLIKKNNIVIENITYLNNVTYTLLINKDKFDFFVGTIVDLTSSHSNIEILGNLFYTVYKEL